jgi:rhodanese-related sulfurtransferase
VLFDMRMKSIHMLEHIPGSSQTAWLDLQAALKKGEFKDLPRKTIVILYGGVYPHYDAPHAFRMAEFDAVYCLEGGLKRWKERGYPVVSDATAVAFAQQQKLEQPAPGEQSHGQADPENIGPAALKLAMDNGLKPHIVFVGDRATFESGRIPGAIHVTFEEIARKFESEDRDRLMLIYCGCCAGTERNGARRAQENGIQAPAAPGGPFEGVEGNRVSAGGGRSGVAGRTLVFVNQR